MDTASLDFFKNILATPSPSGYEEQVQQLVRDYIGPHADQVTTDFHGNVIAGKNPDAPFRVMLAGHCDQIGLIVQHIDKEGFLYVQPIGGWDPIVLVGQRMRVWTKSGPLFGVIARKPIHLLTDEERKQVPKMQDLWLDIGAKDQEQAESLVRIGDAVTVELGIGEMQNGLISSPGMDDKVGVYVVIEALRRVDASKLNCALYAVSTVQEELGLRGARTSCYGVDPQVGIAVDVTFATDCPTIEKKQEGNIAMNKGPVITRGPNMNRHVVDRLIAAADGNEIPYQLAAAGRATGTDANAMQISRAGVATGLVSVPNRYMHSPVEVIALDDADRAATLLARFAEGIEPGANFIP